MKMSEGVGEGNGRRMTWGEANANDTMLNFRSLEILTQSAAEVDAISHK
jgi:hypothetical protein